MFSSCASRLSCANRMTLKTGSEACKISNGKAGINGRRVTSCDQVLLM